MFKPYIELLKTFWNDLINFDNVIEDSYIKNSGDKIKHQIKLGIKEGVKEALDEVLNDISEAETKNQSDLLLKQIAIYSSLLFFGYLIFILPGSGITPEELVQYNWFNQSLIEIKVNIINFFTNPSKPGPGNPDNPTNPLNLDINILKSTVDVGTSPISQSPVSPLTESTVTPNTPKSNLKGGFSMFFKSTTVDNSTQTVLDGKTVGKMVEMTNVLDEVLPVEDSALIKDSVNKLIHNITD